MSRENDKKIANIWIFAKCQNHNFCSQIFVSLLLFVITLIFEIVFEWVLDLEENTWTNIRRLQVQRTALCIYFYFYFYENATTHLNTCPLYSVFDPSHLILSHLIPFHPISPRPKGTHGASSLVSGPFASSRAEEDKSVFGTDSEHCTPALAGRPWLGKLFLPRVLYSYDRVMVWEIVTARGVIM